MCQTSGPTVLCAACGIHVHYNQSRAPSHNTWGVCSRIGADDKHYCTLAACSGVPSQTLCDGTPTAAHTPAPANPKRARAESSAVLPPAKRVVLAAQVSTSMKTKRVLSESGAAPCRVDVTRPGQVVKIASHDFDSAIKKLAKCQAALATAKDLHKTARDWHQLRIHHHALAADEYFLSLAVIDSTDLSLATKLQQAPTQTLANRRAAAANRFETEERVREARTARDAAAVEVRGLQDTP